MIANDLPEQRIGGILYVSTLSHLDAFLLGGSLMIFNVKDWSALWLNIGFSILLVLALLAGFEMYRHMNTGPFDLNDYITHLGYSQEYVQWQHHVWGYTTIDLLVAFSILLMVYYSRKGWGRLLKWFFSIDLLVFFGRISYGMYIIHMGLKHLINPAMHALNVYNKYVVFLVYLPCVVLPAWLIYQQYELRFLKLKERFR
jgi:peptidoglycan/LPS O-acetylase OafA/YrhL